VVTASPGAQPRRWALWRQPPALIAYFLVIDTVAVAATVFFAGRDHVNGHQWKLFGVLAALALVQAELSRALEEARRLITNAPHVNMTTVWCYAAVILLPPSAAGALIAVVYAHLWLRVWRKLGTRPAHRVLFSTAIIVLSAYVTAAVTSLAVTAHPADWASPSTAMMLGVGALVYLVVNGTLVTVAAALHGKPHHIAIAWADYALEIATLCLGIMTAFMLTLAPYLAVVVMPPLLVLHRAVLVKQLEELAIIDRKTGLLNASAWHDVAAAELSRAGRQHSSFGVLMVDLDHFKLVNDTHGHLAGDEVLRAVASLLTSEIRDYDCAGRFGGEEFAVLIPDAHAEQILTTAERLRHRVSELEVTAPTETGDTTITGLSACIGVAVYPLHGTTLERLMLIADSALLTAKTSGRNKVVMITDS
jgi:diguanylate cyclase (GGDEF)-like protein